MKILSIELKNINSLAGEWKIDFTDPSFVQNHNIFVIFGDTGSGKSSILDAITIALYGRTPRQDRINSSGNEVMTRNTASCMARLKYQCRKGVFISEWRQRRAKDKISGKLQDPEFCVMRDDGTVYGEGKAANLADVTTSIIELDYKQFVRSIILAQGEFSKFLDCKPNERAEILEKLDGSDNYRKIAMAIATRADEEEHLFQKKKDESDFITGKILSEEVFQQKKEEITGLTQKKTTLDKKLEELRKYEQWYSSRDEKQGLFDNASKRLKQAENDILDFEPLSKKLSDGEKSAGCEASYTLLASARNTLQTDTESRNTSLNNLAAAKEELTICEENHQKAQDLFKNCEAEKTEKEELWNKVKNLDIQIETALSKANEAKKKHDDAFTDLTSAVDELEKTRKSVESAAREVEKYAEYAKSHIIDGGLTAILPVLNEKKSQLSDIDENIKSLTAEKNELKPELTRLEAEYNEFDAERQEVEKYLDENKKDSELVNLLPSLKMDFESIKRDTTALSEARSKLEQNEIKTSSVQNELDTLFAEKQEILSELDRCFADDALFIAGELQKRLEKGKPCPVCGSLKHPVCDVANGAVSAPAASGAVSTSVASSGANGDQQEVPSVAVVLERTSAFAERIRSVQGRKEDITEAIQKAETAKTLLENEKKALLAEQKELSDAIETAEEKFYKAAGVYATEPAATFAQNATAAPEKREKEALLRFLEEKSAKYRDNERNLGELKEKLNSLNVELVGKKKDYESNGVALNTALGQQNALLEQIKEMCASWLSPDDVSALEGAGAESSFVSAAAVAEKIYSELFVRAESWNTNAENTKSAEQKLTEFSTQEKTVSASIKILESNEDNAKEELSLCNKELSGLQEERHALFGETDVDESRRVFNARYENLRTDMETSDKAVQNARLSVKEHETSVRESEERIKADESRCAAAQKAFDEKLAETGFAFESEFLACRLEENELVELRQRRTELAENKISAQSALREAEKSLVAHKSLYKDIPAKEEVASQKLEAEYELDEVSSSVGRINAELEENERNKAAAADKLAALEAQKAVRDKWAKLRSLMGNKDGSSFSIFVQGITFRHLLKLANRHLALMKDRYELVPKGDVDFEINDASFSSPRSVTNISGGERFLISLSLALGIADFASRTVRVDSLFLDEGFGSLDGETLRNVLDCLKRQQQKEGKMLGIITHVDAVVDSIAQKIEVKPAAGGHSIIRGEGVSG